VTQTVAPNDIAFGVHAVVMTLVVLYQFYLYKGAGANPISKIHAYLISILWVLALWNLLLSSIGSLPWFCPSSCSQLSLIDYLGYGKAVISFIKYTPQAYLNWKRQSTVGWSITNILLDFTGGSLSFLQQFLDAYNYDDPSIIYGNIPKLLLAVESVGFDILFMIQHYVLYTDRHDPIADINKHQSGNSLDSSLLSHVPSDPNGNSSDTPNGDYPPVYSDHGEKAALMGSGGNPLNSENYQSNQPNQRERINEQLQPQPLV